MQVTINIDFKITYKTNKNNINTINISKNLEVGMYLDRIEECYGYHEVWECDDDSIEEAIDKFKDDLEPKEIEEWACDNLADNEYIVDIINVEVI